MRVGVGSRLWLWIMGGLSGFCVGWVSSTPVSRLSRLGRSQESRAACDKAIELAGNTAETAYLIRRRDQLG